MHTACSLQETVSSLCSLRLFGAPFSAPLPLERWLFPPALPRLMLLRHKPVARAALDHVLGSDGRDQHRKGSIHQPLTASCILAPS